MSTATVQEVIGADQVSTVDLIGTAAKRLEDISTEMAKAKDEDTARYQQLKAELEAQASTLDTLKAKHDAEVRDSEVRKAIEMAAEAKAALANIRQPSLAQRIGSGRSESRKPGDFIKALYEAHQVDDLDARREAKAKLETWGTYSAADPAKATLGSSAATGGWIIPNDPIEDMLKPGAYTSPILQLVTTVRGLNIAGIDIPFRTANPTAAVVIPWGNLKTNVDLAYNGYTATMYTLAQIYDVSKQFVMKSAGAAEQDVMQELNGALQRGVATYIYQGTGSSQPFGLNAALVTSPPFTPSTTSSHSPAAATVAGNFATAIATAAGALEARNRRAEAALMSATAYWTVIANGDDDAGFYIAPAGGPSSVNLQAQVSIWGIPVYRESEYLSGSDDMIVGEFSALKVYFGEGPRFDSSDIANTRWDYNLIGFRGELEMAFDARPAVYTGALQFVADVIP